MSHSECVSKSDDSKHLMEEGEMASNADANDSLDTQMKTKNLSASSSDEGDKRKDADLKDVKFKNIIEKTESQLKQDANHVMPILESLLKIGDCVQKRDLRFELLKKYVCHLQECDAKEVINVSRITREMLTSEELKKLIVDSTSVYETNQIIGKGTFSCIILGRLKQPDGTKKRVAIKGVPISVKRVIINEAEVMAHLDHVNIVKIFAFQQDDYKLIMEYLELGDIIKCVTNRQFPSNQYLQFVRDIASGMEYMVKKKYVHCDLACRNVFVNQNLQCKIGDFGLSQYVGDSDGVYETEHRGYPIAIAILPPESRTSGNIKLSWKTDVWSMGILIWEMFSLLEFPACVLRLPILEQLVFGFPTQLPNIGKCPRRLYDYNISKIMNANPNKRPTFTMIKNEISGMM